MLSTILLNAIGKRQCAPPLSMTAGGPIRRMPCFRPCATAVVESLPIISAPVCSITLTFYTTHC